jgi:ATP-binding cassette subfamily F protein uup
VLDEPTNDLDVETLEALEQRLTDYQGTLIAVSHDRHFLDAVVTKTLVFEADGIVRQYAGGYSDWAHQHRLLAIGEDKALGGEGKRTDKSRKKSANNKLSYKLKRELEGLPEKIEKLELKVERMNAEISHPDFYKQEHDQTAARIDELKSVERELSTSVERWAELEQLASQIDT